MNESKKKPIRVVAIVLYLCILFFVGKGFVERAVVKIGTEAILDKIVDGLDDETMNSFISQMVGEGIIGSFLQKNINGDDVNDIYHALTYRLSIKVTAIEKVSAGSYRVGIRIRNCNNVAVTKEVIELINERYEGSTLHKIDQGLEDLDSDKTQLLVNLFVEAVNILEAQMGSELYIAQDYVVDFDSDGNLGFENTNGDISFICFCAGILVDAEPAGRIRNEFSIYGLGLAFALIVPIGVYIYYRRIKSSKYSSEPSIIADEPIPSTSAPNAGYLANNIPVLYAITPQHDNVLFAVHDTPIFIGRDSSCCKVIFDDKTEGVSRKHCSISFDKDRGCFVLTDLQSTYGTFLSNGEKLNVNMPYLLKSGDSFFIGYKSNTFRVELKKG